jgi:hypothetical protein
MFAFSSRSARFGALMLVGLLGAPLAASAPARAQVSIGISVNVLPPALPVYVQPALPGPGYIWTPGYWAWDPDIQDYYWVPGAWVLPPRIGFLWTPGYWGWNDGVYIFHGGYWGPTVGFYGGVNYGFGYTPNGYYGGQWRGGQFFYNSSVTNVSNTHITNVYNKTVIVNNTTNTSVNGGPNGTKVKPTPAQLAAAKAPHVPATPAQVQHFAAAKSDPKARLSANHGKPATAAVEKPLGGTPPAAEEKKATETGDKGLEKNKGAEKGPKGLEKPTAHTPAPKEHKAATEGGRPKLDEKTTRPVEHREATHPVEHKPMEHRAMERPPQHMAPPPRQQPPRMAPQRMAPPRPAPHPGPAACRGPHCK